MSSAEPDDLLQITLASIGDAVIATDAEGRITFLNPVAEALTGWPAVDAHGRPLDEVFQIVNEQSRQPVENPVDKVLRLGQIVGLANHTVLIARDGTEWPIDDSAAPIKGADGRLRGVVLVFRDITERKQAEISAAERHRITALRADIGVTLAVSRPLQSGLQACCEALVQHLDMAFARVWTLDAANAVLDLVASAGIYTHLDGPHSKVPLGQFKIGRIAANRSAHLTNDVPNDPNVSDQSWAKREGMVAFAGYPLIVDEKVVGVLAMFARQPLTESLLDDLAPLTDQIAQHIERKRAEARLRESEQRYRLIGQAANDAIWDWDLVTNKVVWNEGVQARFGYAADQIGDDASWWIEHIHAGDRERVSHGIHAVIDRGGAWQDEYRFLRADGTYAVVFDRGRVVRDKSGLPIRMVGSMLDMTERRLADESLRFQLDLTKSITDNATTAIFMMDDKSRCTFMNPAAEVMTGFRFEEVSGGILHDFIHHHRPDGTHYPMAECPIDRALPEHSEVPNHEDVFFRKNGEAFPVTCNARVIYKAGTAIGTVIEVRDTSAERQAAEATHKRSEQLRRLAEVATRIGVAHDVGSVVGIVTEEVRQVIEAHQSVASITVDQNWAQAITAVSISEKYEHWRNYDRPPDGSGIYSLVCRTNRPLRLTQAELEEHPAWKNFGGDKDHPPMRGWLAAPFVGRDGRNLGLIQLSDKVEGDFTEDDKAVLVQLAQMASVAIENARLVESLRDADRRKDEFLATLGHELRNPLAPIRMGIDILQTAGGDAALRDEMLSTMERQTQQMVRLIDDLLDVSRITQNKLQLRRARVELAEVVRSAVEASQPFIREAGHTLTHSLPVEPIHLDADPNRLAQVISNLLNNSAKYTPEGGTIRLTAQLADEGVIVSVIDNGIGIPVDMQHGIFEMFSQIDRPMEKGYKGLGIGLTLVKRLIEMHGGRVSVQSAGENRGSEFSIWLPVVTQQKVEAPHNHRSTHAVPAKHRVLVADDNAAAAEMLAMVVRLLGHDVQTAGDGREAVEIAAQFAPNVVLMDLGMPRMNGYEAARHIRQQPWGRKLLLVALTGWGQEEDRQRTQEAGFDLHLVKPAEPSELQKLLAEHPIE